MNVAVAVDDEVRYEARPSASEAGPAAKRIVVGYGFWIFLLSDIIMFAALFAAYAVLTHATAGGPNEVTGDVEANRCDKKNNPPTAAAKIKMANAMAPLQRPILFSLARVTGSRSGRCSTGLPSRFLVDGGAISNDSQIPPISRSVC